MGDLAVAGGVQGFLERALTGATGDQADLFAVGANGRRGNAGTTGHRTGAKAGGDSEAHLTVPTTSLREAAARAPAVRTCRYPGQSLC